VKSCRYVYGYTVEIPAPKARLDDVVRVGVEAGRREPSRLRRRRTFCEEMWSRLGSCMCPRCRKCAAASSRVRQLCWSQSVSHSMGWCAEGDDEMGIHFLNEFEGAKELNVRQ